MNRRSFLSGLGALVAALMIIVPAIAKIDILTPGDQIEEFNIPNVYPCENGTTCHGLWFTIRFNKPFCIRYDDIWAKRPDGSALAVDSDESGELGQPGYELNIYVDDSGPMILHIRNVNTCSPSS